MKDYRRLLIAVAGVLALGLGPSLAQPVTQQDVSGNECWNVGQGPGGPSVGALCINTVRNGAALALISGSGAATTTVAPGQGVLMWTGAAPTTWTVTTPSPAFDGQYLVLGTVTTLTTMVTLTAASGQSLATTYSAQTLTAGTSAVWQYSRGTTTWYRIR